ncbi:universal stress protein [Streptomyces sp. So13.3]|nr:universal stress protein [Streptomyces sp. So13.3]
MVVTAHRRQGLLGPQLGPVTTLLHHSHCPVLLVPETPQGSLPGPSHS